MANTLKLRRSATAGSVPTTAQLALGELAMNTADGKLFMKTDDGAGTTEVVEIGSGGSITIASAPPEGADPGDIYWDQDDGSAYIYYDDGNGAAQWVPLTPLAESVIPGASADKFDDISGSFNGVLTDFTININGSAHSPLYQNATLISIGGVIQEAGTAYTISGSTISFTTAPAAGLDFFGIDLASPVLIGTPNDGTVTSAKLDTDLTIDLASGSATSPSITFDSNTGIYSPGADQVALSTNGTGRLFVDASGNVGIGTSPTNPLTVVGTAGTGANAALRIEDESAQAVTIGVENDGDAIIDYLTKDLAFTANSSEKLRITSAGLVGIGTSTPSSALEVTGFIQSSSGLKFNDTDSAFGLFPLGTQTLAFNINSSEKVRINAAGNVGIGTTSPGQPLTIAGANPQIGLPDGAGNTATIGVAQGGGGIGNLIITGIASKNITFNSPSSEFARIDSSGRLLVGTSTSFQAEALIQTSKSSGANTTIIRSESLSDNDTSRCLFRGTTGAATRNAQVGVAKHSAITNPVGFVEFDSEDAAQNFIWADNSGILRISSTFAHLGTTSGTVVGTQTSDERIKNILGPVEYGLDALKQIEPIRYALKTEPDVQRLGFIAQQVLPLVPESVFDTNEHIEGEPGDAPTKLGMEYISLIPVLVNAIKELSAEVDSLKAQLQAS